MRWEISSVLGFHAFPPWRGIHFQPISYFGRFPEPPCDEMRLTLPRIMRELVAQTDGMASLSHFRPSRCEHERCSFRAVYLVESPDKIIPRQVSHVAVTAGPPMKDFKAPPRASVAAGELTSPKNCKKGRRKASSGNEVAQAEG